jgi:ankyrin repeat protein
MIGQGKTISDIDAELSKYPEEVQLKIINYTDPTSEFGNTLLIYTIMKEKPAITNYLLDKGADITIVNAEGDTALIMGLTYLNDVDVIKRLLKDKEHNNRANVYGQTALMMAIISPSFTKEETLTFIDLLANPEVIDKQTSLGTTALMYVVKKPIDYETRTTLINKLLEYNPNVNLKNDNSYGKNL